VSKVKKSYPVVELKADSANKGIVEAVASVFGNVDLVGDRVVPGAFQKSIAEWKGKNARGRFLPFTDEHDWSRLGRIGKVIDLAETEEGLKVTAQLFMEQESARDVYGQMKEGVVGEFSFAYDVVKERKAKDGANELVELAILDIASTLHGANPETRLVSIKTDETTADEWHVKGGSGAATDDSPWEEGPAMAACDSAADFRAICAGERSEGEPDERQHWALPHHKRPGAAANASAVGNARARFEQTQGLSNKEAARRHLFSTHTLPSDKEAEEEGKALAVDEVGLKVGRMISSENESTIQQIRDSAQQARDLAEGLLSFVRTEPVAEESDNGKAKERPMLDALRKQLEDIGALEK
jgi:HK97 family phage prohead protease